MNTQSLAQKVAIITGGSGALGSAMAAGLLREGVKVAILGRSKEKLTQCLAELQNESLDIIGISADVVDRSSLERARQKILSQWGKIDILINAAGGNVKGAIVMPDENFFDMKMEDFDTVTALNLKGTVLPTLVFGEQMARQSKGCIINISSMAADRPLTRVVGYSAAKASINNFTQWLAVELATKHSENIRVNAIAPGFFIGEQNKELLLNKDGSLTARGETIINQTPMNRFGRAEELISTVLWLSSDASSFITGAVIPVDGGFGAFSGV